MEHRQFNVLFLCTGNTARSILAEGILRKKGGPRFNAFSAGSQPKGVVNAFALKTLAAFDCPVTDYRSKSWDEFAQGPTMDFIFTVCDNAAGESCPIWPGHPMTAHWGVEDPAHIEGTEIQKEAAFTTAFKQLRSRILVFINLPFDKLQGIALRNRLRDIGLMAGATPASMTKP